jgi:hypothetical protein
MSYRALFTADVHLCNTLPFAVRDPDTLITDRLRDVLDVLDQMCAYACEEGISDVWIVGDLLDKRLVDAVTLKLVADALAGPSSLAGHHNVWISPGNHEAHDADCRHYAVDALGHLHQPITVIGGEGSWVEPVSGFRIYAMPYLPPARAHRTLDGLGAETADLLLIHQTVRGACVGGWQSPDGLDPAQLLDISKHVLAGHFHSPQDIRADGHSAPMSYLGAPLQHHFADVGDSRGFWDFTFTSDGRLGRKVPIDGAPRFHSLQWIVGGEPPDVSAISQKDYVDLRISGSRAKVDKFWKEAQSWADKLAVERATRMIKLTPDTDVEPAKRRIVLGDGERPSWEQIVGRYLAVADCMDLDRKRLADLAKELIQDGEA